jgi:hypothetical protein
MTNKELKKWLKRCAATDSLCDGCPFEAHSLCFDEIKLAALALIKKQEKEIKQLKTECALLDDELRNARQETIDVLNELKAKSYVNDYCREVVEVEKIDELTAEVQNAEDKS